MKWLWRQTAFWHTKDARKFRYLQCCQIPWRRWPHSWVFYLIGDDLADSFNSAYQNGHLSISQWRGVISLIPKEESSLKLQNWIPITLLNVGYKIASKAIAKQIEPLNHCCHSWFIQIKQVTAVRQRCPLLSYLFIQTAKRTSNKICQKYWFQMNFCVWKGN